MTLPSVKDRRRLRAKFATIASLVFAPPSRVSVSDHADANRFLSREAGAVEEGPWRTDRVPYLREIMDSLGDPTLRRVVFMKSSQVGGSECGHSWLTWIIDQAPAPILMLYPTDDAFKTWSTIKLTQLIQDTPCLRDLVLDTGGRRDQRNTMSRKRFPGGFLVGLAARSSARLRSLSAPFAIAEEVDEYEEDVNRQGDPLELLERALRNFLESGGKLYVVSTPTFAGVSRIEREYEQSDQRHYYVPCPHCGVMQQLVWQDAEGRYRLICDRNEQGELIPETARYLCVECGTLIEQHHRDDMLARGQWRATKPGRKTRGYHVNTLYSPFVSWAAIVAKFLQSRHSPALLKTFVNLWLGLPFEERGEKIEPYSLAARAEPYGRTDPEISGTAKREWDVPRGVGLLTAFADVQGDRIEAFCWGWGAGEEAWVLDWSVFEGDPGQDAGWKLLDEWLLHPWMHEMGATMRIVAAGVDANYQKERVHRFCDARTARRIIPTVGKAGRGRQLITAPGALKYRTAGLHKARPSYIIGTDAAKDLLASRLRIAEPGPEYVHFSELLDPVFYDQLTAERLMTVYVAGIPTRRWVKLEGRANEALDGAVGNMAVLAHLGMPVIRQLGVLAKQIAEAGAGAKPAAPPPVPARRMRSPGLQW